MDDAESVRREFAAAFGKSLDPLAEYAPVFEEIESDPFDLFTEVILRSGDLKESTLRSYDSAYDQWREYMEMEGRHPACPNEEHVLGFVRWLYTEQDNERASISNKLIKLNRAYQYFQEDSAFRHPKDYNPFNLARDKIRWSDFEDGKDKKPHRIPISTLQEIVGEITHIRKRLYIVAQLKLGLRVSELCNIKLEEVSIENQELRQHFPDLGTHRRIEDYENAIYIPSKHERDGNKSQVPRILPLDEDMRRVLLSYLLIRPEHPDNWLILSGHHTQCSPRNVNRAWKQAFHPRYAETDEYRPVTSHYGRHRFTTFWRIEQDIPRELVQYMRGDRVGGNLGERGSIDNYLWTYYPDIEEIYRSRIFKLRI